MQTPVKVAIVGCGSFAQHHVSALRELGGIEIVGVCDRDRDRAEAMAIWAKGTRPYQSLVELIQTEKANVVHILTPPETHASLAIQAMEMGCHVLVEKPMALSVIEADRMIEAARANAVKLSTNHNYLFDPCILTARRLVQEGQIGQVVHIDGYYGLAKGADDYRSTSGRSHWAWRLPGSAFTNFYPHMIYLAGAFLPDDISVKGVTLGRESGVDSLPTELSVLLDSGDVSAFLAITMRVQPYAKFLNIYGTRGIIHADLSNQVCTIHRTLRAPGMVSKVLYNFEESIQLAAGTITNTVKVALGLMKSNPGLRNHLREFYSALINDGNPPVSGEHGRKMIDIMEATWVKFPESVSNPKMISKLSGKVSPKTKTEHKLVEIGIPGKALVTGATGRLGYYLVDALVRSGVEVRVLVRDLSRVPREFSERVEVVPGDIRDLPSLEVAMQGVSIVYHCAAITKNYMPRKVHTETNILGTENVLKAALNAKVDRVVHMSSVIVYGLSDGMVDENSPYPAVTDQYANYMITKIEADKCALKYFDKYGLPVTVLRLGVLYGPKVGRSLHGGLIQLGLLKFAIGSGRNHLPNTFIRNAVDCSLLASISPQAVGQVYNVVDEPQLKSGDFIKNCERISGERSIRIAMPAFMMHFGAQILEWQATRKGGRVPPKLSHFVVKSACRDIYYSTAKVKEQLDWEPPISMEDRLKEALDL